MARLYNSAYSAGNQHLVYSKPNKGGPMIRNSARFLVWLAAGAMVVQSQISDRASIRGQVIDESRGVVTGARVELRNDATGFQREAVADAAGSFSLSDLPLTGDYRLNVKKEGFAEQQAGPLSLRAGESAFIEIVLSPQSGKESVTVYGTVDGVRTDSPQAGTRLDLPKIDNTAVLGRKMTNLVLLDSAVRPARGTGDLFLNNTLFVVNAGGRRQTSFVIDGSTADDAWGRQTIFTNVPLSAVEEFTVLTNSFSSEFGRTTSGVVNLVTRTGTNTWHGDGIGVWRPGGIQARAPGSNLATPDRLGQISGSLSGPIVQDRTQFLVAAEYSRQRRDSTITSPLAPGTYTGTYDPVLVFARVDHRFSQGHQAGLRLNMDHFTDTNPADAVGSLTLPSAARVFRRAAYGIQASDQWTINSRVVNEARAQFQVASPVTEFIPVTPSTQYVRPGLATEGDSRSARLQNHQWQLADVLSLSRGAHQLRLGGDVIYSSSGGFGQEFGGGYVLGQFTLKLGVTTPIPQLTANDMQRYTQSFGNASYKLTQWLGSVFAQDNWRISPNLTLDAGLRYERQSYSDDTAMWSPRVGLAWHPGHNPRTVLRAGYGLYYSQLRANLAAGYSIGGPEGIVSFSAAPGQYGFPEDLKPLTEFPPGAPLPARDITVEWGQRQYLSRFFDVSKLARYPDRILNPRTQQWSAGFEREILPRWTLAADYVGQRTSRIDRPIDLNAPSYFARTGSGQVRTAAAADATRPITPVPNGFRRIIVQVNDGLARYDALQTRVTRRLTHGFSLLASYTYSNAINTVEPDVPGQDPNDANRLGRSERASSLLNQRHRAALSGWWQFARKWTWGGGAFLASGRPFTVTTGVDNNGDGSNTDRPVVGGVLMGRNAPRGTPQYDVQTFVQRDFLFFTEKLRSSIRAEAFNLFNHSNVVGRNGVWGNGETPLPAFGQALTGINNVDPGRMFQFSLRLAF